jgi:hypothetical protein
VILRTETEIRTAADILQRAAQTSLATSWHRIGKARHKHRDLAVAALTAEAALRWALGETNKQELLDLFAKARQGIAS